MKTPELTTVCYDHSNCVDVIDTANKVLVAERVLRRKHRTVWKRYCEKLKTSNDL